MEADKLIGIIKEYLPISFTFLILGYLFTKRGLTVGIPPETNKPSRIPFSFPSQTPAHQSNTYEYTVTGDEPPFVYPDEQWQLDAAQLLRLYQGTNFEPLVKNVYPGCSHKAIEAAERNILNAKLNSPS